MPLPSKSDIVTLDYVDWSLPSFWVEAKSLDSGSLDYIDWSLPIVGTAASTSPVVVSSNVYVNVSGTWKQASQVYVNVSGVWKDVVDDKFYVKVGASWKS